MLLGAVTASPLYAVRQMGRFLESFSLWQPWYHCKQFAPVLWKERLYKVTPWVNRVQGLDRYETVEKCSLRLQDLSPHPEDMELSLCCITSQINVELVEKSEK